MKPRSLLPLVVALLAVAPLGAQLAAHADPGGRGRWERQERGDRPFPRGRDFDRGAQRRGGYDRGPPPDFRGDAPRYEARPYGPPPSRDVRRGGYIPPQYRGEAMGDYGRHRLRPPPRGYGWHRVPGGYALVDEYSGRVFDMIPQ